MMTLMRTPIALLLIMLPLAATQAQEDSTDEVRRSDATPSR